MFGFEELQATGARSSSIRTQVVNIGAARLLHQESVMVTAVVRARLREKPIGRYPEIYIAGWKRRYCRR